jgi:hypothetical protein
LSITTDITNNVSKKSTWFIFLLLFLGLAILFILDIFLGSVNIKAGDVWRALFAGGSEHITETIILNFRLPKAITAVLVGMALSVSGLQMQTIFRNPMAGPDILGITAGASLGVAFVVLGFSGSVSPDFLKSFGNWMLAIASWIGAGLLMMVILALSIRIKDIMTILILGIMLCEGGFSLMETDEMNFDILKNVTKALKPNAKLIFTTLNGLFPIYNSLDEFYASTAEEGNSLCSQNSFDFMTFRVNDIVEFTDDSGNKKTLECNERCYVPSEITWLLKSLGYKTIDIFGARLGEFSREHTLTTKDFEMLVIASFS